MSGGLGTSLQKTLLKEYLSRTEEFVFSKGLQRFQGPIDQNELFQSVLGSPRSLEPRLTILEVVPDDAGDSSKRIVKLMKSPTQREALEETLEFFKEGERRSRELTQIPERKVRERSTENTAPPDSPGREFGMIFELPSEEQFPPSPGPENDPPGKYVAPVEDPEPRRGSRKERREPPTAYIKH